MGMGRREACGESGDCGPGEWAERYKGTRSGCGCGEGVPEVHRLAGRDRCTAPVSSHGHRGSGEASAAYGCRPGLLTAPGNQASEEKRRESTAANLRTRIGEAFNRGSLRDAKNPGPATTDCPS